MPLQSNASHSLHSQLFTLHCAWHNTKHIPSTSHFQCLNQWSCPWRLHKFPVCHPFPGMNHAHNLIFWSLWSKPTLHISNTHRSLFLLLDYGYLNSTGCHCHCSCNRGEYQSCQTSHSQTIAIRLYSILCRGCYRTQHLQGKCFLSGFASLFSYLFLLFLLQAFHLIGVTLGKTYLLRISLFYQCYLYFTFYLCHFHDTAEYARHRRRHIPHSGFHLFALLTIKPCKKILYLLTPSQRYIFAQRSLSCYFLFAFRFGIFSLDFLHLFRIATSQLNHVFIQHIQCSLSFGIICLYRTHIARLGVGKIGVLDCLLRISETLCLSVAFLLQLTI